MSDQQKTVLKQIKSAKAELDAYAPEDFDWYQRSVDSANAYLPWLVDVAPKLKSYVEEVVNSRNSVREYWGQIAKQANGIPEKLRDKMQHSLDNEAILLAYLGGDVMSKVIEKFLIESCKFGDLESNGRSDYPDLFLRSSSYDGLPVFKRKGEGEYGASLKGPARRPVRVPDGLEVKTCRKRLAVDCHHAHAGLHLALIVTEAEGKITVTDISVAYMKYSDYRITKPNSKTTTLKASFNGDNFISLLGA